MKTSQTWWNETKSDEAKLNAWLVRQYIGESTAAARLLDLFQLAPARDTALQRLADNDQVIAAIVAEELKHATWIGDLLKARGVPLPEVSLEAAHGRYWKHTLPGITSFETGAGVAAHAEKMRLERIEVIASDMSADADIRETFFWILQEERGHERAFREMAGAEAMAATAAGHAAGREALGLVA